MLAKRKFQKIPPNILIGPLYQGTEFTFFFQKQVRQIYDMICAVILPHHVLITKIKNRVPDTILEDKVVVVVY